MFPVRVALSFLLVIGAAVAQQYVISTVAGGAPPPTPIAGVNASIGSPFGAASDATGNVYFSSHNCIFKLDPNGVLTRIAGNSRPGYAGDGGPSANAQLNGPEGIALDGAGNLYIADSINGVIRKVSPNGIITTMAGGGNYFFGIAVDANGTLYASDTQAVYRISTNGTKTTIPGTDIGAPTGITVDAGGSIYIADVGDHRIRKISPSLDFHEAYPA